MKDIDKWFKNIVPKDKIKAGVPTFTALEVIKILTLQMKQAQTFKFDPDLLIDLQKEAIKNLIPFNRYVENLLKTHPKRKKVKASS